MSNLPEALEPCDYTCENCENSTIECTTKYLYCMRGPTWRIILFGPRRVPYSYRCKYLILRKVLGLVR